MGKNQAEQVNPNSLCVEFNTITDRVSQDVNICKSAIKLCWCNIRNSKKH